MVAGTALEEEELGFDDDKDEDVFLTELEDFAEEETAFEELLDFLTLLLLLDFEEEVTLADDDEVFLAELADEVFLTEEEEDDLEELLLVDELFLVEEVVFALVLLEEDEERDVLAKNSGRMMTAPPTRVVEAIKTAGLAASRSTISASAALTL